MTYSFIVPSPAPATGGDCVVGSRQSVVVSLSQQSPVSIGRLLTRVELTTTDYRLPTDYAPLVPRPSTMEAWPAEQCYHCKQWVEEGEAHDCWTTTEAALTEDLSEDLQDAWERLRETAVDVRRAAHLRLAQLDHVLAHVVLLLRAAEEELPRSLRLPRPRAEGAAGASAPMSRRSPSSPTSFASRIATRSSRRSPTGFAKRTTSPRRRRERRGNPPPGNQSGDRRYTRALYCARLEVSQFPWPNFLVANSSDWLAG